MKKLAIMIAAALLALIICAAALANETAAELYAKTRDLLFSTENVTLSINAEFSLDGVWFKTVEGTWKQDGDRGFRQLLLRSPKADGSERKNGYTIVTDGDKLNLMEVFTPGHYTTGFSAGRKSILRNTVETKALNTLAEAMAAQSDLLLGEGAITKTAEGDFLIKLNDNVPKMANAALNQFVRFAAKRYFGMDYDRMRADNSMSMFSFVTVTEGLLYTMQEVSIRQAEITMKTDTDGRLQHAEGTVGLYVNTAADGLKQLDISFRADVSDIGSTTVKKFNPEDYQVVQSIDQYGIVMEAGEEVIAEELPAVNGALIDEIEKEAMRIWEKTGFNTVGTTSVSCRMLDNGYEVSFEGNYAPALKSYFRLDGQFANIQAEPSDWQYADHMEYNFDPKPDAKTDQTAKEFLTDFLETVHPDLLNSVKDLKMEWIYETNGAVYAQYHEDPLDQEGDGVLFVIRISPEMRIEYYSCVSNG